MGSAEKKALGTKSYKAKRFSKAILYYLQAAEDARNDVDYQEVQKLYGNVAAAAMELGNYTYAIECCKAAVSYDPDETPQAWKDKMKKRRADCEAQLSEPVPEHPAFPAEPSTAPFWTHESPVLAWAPGTTSLLQYLAPANLMMFGAQRGGLMALGYGGVTSPGPMLEAVRQMLLPNVAVEEYAELPAPETRRRRVQLAMACSAQTELHARLVTATVKVMAADPHPADRPVNVTRMVDRARLLTRVWGGSATKADWGDVLAHVEDRVAGVRGPTLTQADVDSLPVGGVDISHADMLAWTVAVNTAGPAFSIQVSSALPTGGRFDFIHLTRPTLAAIQHWAPLLADDPTSRLTCTTAGQPDPLPGLMGCPAADAPPLLAAALGLIVDATMTAPSRLVLAPLPPVGFPPDSRAADLHIGPDTPADVDSAPLAQEVACDPYGERVRQGHRLTTAWLDFITSVYEKDVQLTSLIRPQAAQLRHRAVPAERPTPHAMRDMMTRWVEANPTPAVRAAVGAAVGRGALTRKMARVILDKQ